MNSLPSACGTYVLVYFLSRSQKIEIGQLGEIAFRKGYYLYVGSAFGRGGLSVRLGHHLNPKSPQRWHIDYLGRKAELKEVWFTTSPIKLEHQWADVLAGTVGKQPFRKKFGSSDCSCYTHLFYFARKPSKEKLMEDTGEDRLVLQEQVFVKTSQRNFS
jgi:Uri superfamily endonuclease